MMRETSLTVDVENTGPDAKVIAGTLADGDRRRIFAAIELGAVTLLDAAKASGLPDHRAARALARLVDSRLVVGDRDGGLRVDGVALTNAARAASTRLPSDEHAAEQPERRKILEAFVREGLITSMPTAPAKRAVVLDWLARRFEIGRRYPEAEVNRALDGHAEDHVSLRRSLIDAELLCRDDGMYWRCGGTVDP